MDVTGSPAKPRLRRLLFGGGAVLGVLVLLLAMAQSELENFIWELRYERWQEACAEDPDQREACGRTALVQLGYPSSFDTMREGLATADRLCAEQKVHRACVLAARSRSPERAEQMMGNDFLRDARERVAQAACSHGDNRGCFVAAWFSRLTVAQLESTARACREGDEMACFAREMSKGPKPVCGEDVYGPCMPPVPRACLDGGWEACPSEADPAARILTEAPTQWDNPAMFQVALDVEGLAASCEAGSAAACFVMGLNATADINPFDGEPQPLRSLNLSMGRACELGANIACYVFALRLLDVNFNAKRETARARQLLDVACDRGHDDSCALRRQELYEYPRDLAAARRETEARCRNDQRGEACMTWAHILAFDLGAEPFLRIEADAQHRFEDACRDAGSVSACQEATGVHGVAPLYVRSASLAGEACRGGDVYGCMLVFDHARHAQEFGMKTPDELRAEICPQLPAACHR